jgi:hypothetical protein
MRTEYAFKLASDALDRGTGTLIARVRVKADAKDLPDLEGVPQHEELGFGIRTGTNRGLREPRITDLAGVRETAPVIGMSLGPCPPFDIPEARGTDHGSVLHANHCERDGGASLLPGQGCVDVFLGLGHSLGNGTPAVQRGIGGRCAGQSVGVIALQRFEANVLALQRGIFGGHHLLTMQFGTPRGQCRRPERTLRRLFYDSDFAVGHAETEAFGIPL